MSQTDTTFSSNRPSFFEIYATQHLNSALRPALRYLLDVLAIRHPRLRPVSNWFEECFTALLLFVDSAQLSQQSALLSESFYGLRRTSSPTFSASPSLSILSRSQLALAIFLDVMCPYLRSKIEAYHSAVTGGAAAALFQSSSALQPAISFSEQNSFPFSAPVENSPSHQIPHQTRFSSWISLLFQLFSSPARAIAMAGAFSRYLRSTQFRTMLVQRYPLAKSLFDMCNTLLNLLYLYGYSRYFCVSLLLQRLVLRRDSQLDILQFTLKDKLSIDGGTLGFGRTVQRVLTLLKTGLLASIFAFRFLQFYYAAEVGIPILFIFVCVLYIQPTWKTIFLVEPNQLMSNINICVHVKAAAPRDTGPILAPPEPLLPAPGVDERNALAPGMCPICHQTRVNPTACVSFRERNTFSTSISPFGQC